MQPTLTDDLADRFAAIALGHVTREYPNALSHVLSGPADARTPSDLHPVFFGSFDLHSCVHGYWMLARLLRTRPALASAEAIGELFDRQLVAGKVEGECRYFARPTARGFERPYGWAWLLKLAAELRGLNDGGWAAALAPLAEVMVRRFQAFLPVATYPVRVGTHYNTAFALRLAADYAEGEEDAALSVLLRDTALRWYGGDAACPAWCEPSGDDLLSSSLIEAECMRRLLPEAEFRPWLERFLPRLAASEPAVLFRPAAVSDRTDGKIAHLDGLNLSRAWCWRALSRALPPGDPRVPLVQEAAERHCAAGLPHVAGDYMGEHWLASFAVLAVEG